MQIGGKGRPLDCLKNALRKAKGAMRGKKRNEINYVRKKCTVRSKRKLLLKSRNKHRMDTKRDAGGPKENISQIDMLRKENDIKINCFRK